jgi:hypothetical protein
VHAAFPVSQQFFTLLFLKRVSRRKQLKPKLV